MFNGSSAAVENYLVLFQEVELRSASSAVLDIVTATHIYPNDRAGVHMHYRYNDGQPMCVEYANYPLEPMVK